MNRFLAPCEKVASSYDVNHNLTAHIPGVLTQNPNHTSEGAEVTQPQSLTGRELISRQGLKLWAAVLSLGWESVLKTLDTKALVVVAVLSDGDGAA